ncbi:mediator of RNA polymerase II transcription subunit 15a-like isoform X2 [Andrographis paniculata]|nr:mediator of RNA polymerase II transcription subunit 15a-like isoform X2 [Andrographis paniculata]
MQSQMPNQPQQLQMPVGSQVRQPLLSQNIQNNNPSAGVPSSAGLASVLPAVPSMSQGTMPNVPVQNPNVQNMSNITPSAVGNSMGQGVPSNIYGNNQRQMQGRQQQVVNPEQPQQSQNSQYLYNQQLHQHLLKQKLQQGGVTQSMMQQQQNLLPQNQLQSSQQGAMQSALRQPSASSTLQNQQSSLQQPNQSMLQQQPQSVLRQPQQQQQQQQSVIPQPQSSMPQHPMMSGQQPQQQQQQQQQINGQQTNPANMQQNQLMSQQNTTLDAQQHQHQHQQQRMIAQQNNLSSMQQQQQTISQQGSLSSMHQQQSTGQQNISNMHPQQLGSQNNLSNFQHQQMVMQHGNSGLQINQQSVHMMPQSKVAAKQQMQQSMANMLPNQAQQPQSQPMQQQMMSQIQSSGQLQQQLGMQQKGSTLSRDMQQRIQTPAPLLQQQTALDQQKQLQSERGAAAQGPQTSLDSSAQTGNVNGADWQEEIYQKIKSMNELYYQELNEMHQRMAAKLQQHDSLPQQPKNEQLEKLRFFRVMLERLIMFLQTSKSDVQPSHKDKIPGVHKQIVNILSSNRPRKHVPGMQQGQISQANLHTMQQSQLQQPPQMHTNDGQMNSQMQPANVQGSGVSTLQNSMSNVQYSSVSSGASNSRANMMDGLQPGSNIETGQGNAMNQMHQVSMSSLQQNPVSSPQQTNINPVSSQSGLTSLPTNVNPLQANSNILQPQQIKQEQQMFSTQQMKQQYQQQRQLHQQYLHKQQMIQQQQQTGQQQPAQLPSQQMMQQLNQMDTNDMKRHQMVVKQGVLQQHNSSSQRPSYHHQQLKPGAAFSISSQQGLQAASPQIGHHASPQVDQQNLLTSHPKSGTPLQSVSSPFVVPSPSTSMAPSPMPGDEKTSYGVSSLANVVHPSTAAASIPKQSLAIGTPGISASPLLAEFTSPDGTHAFASTIVPGSTNVVEQPLERLTKVVRWMLSLVCGILLLHLLQCYVRFICK